MLTGTTIKTLLRGLIGLAAILLVLAFWLFTNPGFPRLYYGNSPKETADILQNDVVWGFRAISKAVTYGDSVIPEIRATSKNFSQLNHRNTYCFANVLGQIKTPLSERTARELFNRNADNGDRDTLVFLCGAWALAQQGKLKSSEKLVRFIRDEDGHSIFREMSIHAAGETGDPSAVAPILEVLKSNQRHKYFFAREACAALEKFADPATGDTLRKCIADTDFKATNACFKALLAIGDQGAIPLAITRLEDASPFERDELAATLESVTGQKFGSNQDAWFKWWREKQAHKPLCYATATLCLPVISTIGAPRPLYASVDLSFPLVRVLADPPNFPGAAHVHIFGRK